MPPPSRPSAPAAIRSSRAAPRPTAGRSISALQRGLPARGAAGALGNDKDKARDFFEQNFRPVRIAKLGEKTGLLTGYYEPIVDGSRFPNPEFSRAALPAPARHAGRRQEGAARPRSPTGRTSAASTPRSRSCPISIACAIENGALDGQRLEIAWLKDPWEAMTIQIQGSARVRLEDGTMLRLNYDAHNGHPYTAVGRILIERDLVPREEMSMDRISQWMAKNPDQAKEVRGTNKSFVFFRITGLNIDTEPPGAQGVPLTPGRSIAVDRIHVYGTPFFIEAELPIDGARTKDQFRRLMVSQDTGSAIIGPARADLYFGAGEDAGAIAGRIRQQGRFVMLLPRELDMIEAGTRDAAAAAEAGRSRRGREAGEVQGDKSKADKAEPRRKRRPKARTSAPAEAAGSQGQVQAETNVMTADDKSRRRRSATRNRRCGAASRARLRRCAAAASDARAGSRAPPSRSRSRRSRHAIAAASGRRHAAAGAEAERRPRSRRSTAAPSSSSRAARNAIDARLDLHGRTQSEAHAALLRFLRRAQANGAKTVLVITGKGGDRDGERGVLKRQVPLWLALPEFRATGGRLRRRRHRPWRRGRALCAGAAREEFGRAPAAHARESGHPESSSWPGPRFAGTSGRVRTTE